METTEKTDGIAHCYRPQLFSLLRIVEDERRSIALRVPIFIAGVGVLLSPPWLLERILFRERNEGTRQVAENLHKWVHIGPA